jgi:hypothetical protein
MMRKLTWLAVSAIVLSGLAFGVDAKDRMGELSKRMEDLSKRAQACGGNAACVNKVMAEYQTLSAEYTRLVQSPQGAAGSSVSNAVDRSCSLCPKCFGSIQPRPGWSCLPVKMRVTDRVEFKRYGSYPVSHAEWKWYLANDVVLAYSAEGSGTLTYTKDYKEFRLDIASMPSDNKLSQFSWKKADVSYSGFTGQKWSSSSGPQGPVKVMQRCALTVVYPPESQTPSKPNFYFNPMSVSCDADRSGESGTRLSDEGSPSLQMTPETVKAMIQSRQFSKTFSFRKKAAASPNDKDPSYENHNLTVSLQIGEPPSEQPGALGVSPGDGFSSSRTDPQKNFEPLSKTYTVKNNGKQAINYDVSKKADWLKLGPTGGSLAPGGSATVTVSVDVSAASKLTEDIYKDTITFTNTTNGKGNTARPADLTIGEEQKWQVFLTGYEIDEMDPYWKITTRVRGAIRFDYKFRGEFSIAKKKGKWQYKNGTITIAEVGLSDLHEPLEVWLVKQLKCQNCAQVTNLKETPLSGYVDGNDVKLVWGKIWPKVPVEAKIKCPCKPLPDCAQWKTRLFVSSEFFDRINNVALPLKHEGVVTPKEPIVSPQGLRWIHYTYTLRRLK